MQNLNIDILTQRINDLRNKKNITQETLAKEIGMSQPNFNRAINQKNGQRFTLEQVFKIAQYFEVSVDYLLGNNKPSDKKTEKDICAFFTNLLEQRKLVKVPFSREEEIDTPYTSPTGNPDCSFEKKKISYDAFIFPKHFDPGPLDRFDEERIDDLRSDILYYGNSDESNKRINSFFAKYFQIYEMFLHAQMSEELFHEITEKFMADLE